MRAWRTSGGLYCRSTLLPGHGRIRSKDAAADRALAAYYCAMDPSTPFKVRATLLGALAYFILPFDVIPDFILGLGFTDDMAVIVTAFTMIRNHLTQDHLDQARETIDRLRTGEVPAET